MLGHYIPAEIEMYYNEVRKMLDFEMMSPDGIIQIFAPNMTLVDLIMPPKNETAEIEDQGMKSSSAETLNFLDNLQVYILAFALFVIILTILGIFAVIPFIRQRILKLITEQVSAFFFNGLINAHQMAYITTCILGIASLQSYVLNGDEAALYQGVAIYLVSLSIPVYIIWFNSHKTPEQLKSPYVRHRYGELYALIDVEKSANAKYYHGVFLLRRLLYVTIPLIFLFAPSLNFEFIILAHTLYLIVYGVFLNMPHESIHLVVTEFINEWLFSLMLYVSLLMTDLAENATQGRWAQDL